MHIKPIVIQCATPPEFKALRVALGGPEVQKIGKRQFVAASDRNIIVLKGALGKVFAAASAEFAIMTWAPRLLVDFGAAGGLIPELRVGDLVLADKIIEHDVSAAKGARPTVEIPDEWYSGFLKLEDVNETSIRYGGKSRRGTLAAGDRDIQTLEDREALAKSSGAIAVTWESSAIARVSHFHAIPFLSIRVVTDCGTGKNHDEFLAEYKAGAEKALLPAAQYLVSLLK